MPVDPHPFLSRLAADWPPSRWAEVTVLIAVSGGADSVALLRGLVALKTTGAGRLVVGHYNHRWRQAASEADEQFVRELADRLGLTVLVERAEAPVRPPDAAQAHYPSESSARQARYAFLARAAHRVGARYVALGHTADDQIETVLHHLFRGTGLAGLAGMPRTRPLDEATTVIRPMLNIWRTELLDYLRLCGQPFREDATNRELSFRRNWLRHQLLPQVEQQFGPQVRPAILRLAQIARQTEQYLRQQAEAWLAQAAQAVPGGVYLRGAADLPPVLVQTAFSLLWKQQGWPRQELTYDKWNLLLAMLVRPGGEQPPACDLPGGVHVQRVGDGLRLTRAADR